MPRTSSRPTRRAPAARVAGPGAASCSGGPSASRRSSAPVAVTAGLSARPRLHNAPRRRPTTRGPVGVRRHTSRPRVSRWSRDRPPADRGAPTGETRTGEQGWAALHGGIRPSAVVRVWLGGVQRLAATGPVARISPDALSVTGVAVAGAAALVAGAGGRWPLLAAVLVVLVGVLDGLDGAVALHTGRAPPARCRGGRDGGPGRRPAAARDARRAGCAAGVVRRGGSAHVRCTSTCGPAPAPPGCPGSVR